MIIKPACVVGVWREGKGEGGSNKAESSAGLAGHGDGKSPRGFKQRGQQGPIYAFRTLPTLLWGECTTGREGRRQEWRQVGREGHCGQRGRK